jgi:hypothetical protein
MGTRIGAKTVELSKMQVTMNKTGSLDGISVYFSTLPLVDMQPNTCNVCHIYIVLHCTGKIMSRNL